jgi:hypothetical protein
MLNLKTPTSVDRARVDAILDAGCRHGCSGAAALVRARVQGGGYQVRIQCLTCGDHLGSALAQTIHLGWRDYPETDPAIAARFRAPSDMGPMLALEASGLLGRDLIAHREIIKPNNPQMLGTTWLADLGFIAAAHWLGADRIWALQSGYRAIGFVGEGKLTPYGTAQAEAMGIEVRLLPSGFAALIRVGGHWIFMDAAGRSVRSLIVSLLSEDCSEEFVEAEIGASE